MNRFNLFSWLIFLVVVSCSPVRYNYFFDRQGTRVAKAGLADLPADTSRNEPVVLPKANFEASASVGIPHTLPAVSSIPKAQKRDSFKNEVQKQKVNAPIPAKNGISHMDKDLKRSIIFVAAGIFALLIGGTVFWVLGCLSLAIGIIFGIKWLVRQ